MRRSAVELVVAVLIAVLFGFLVVMSNENADAANRTNHVKPLDEIPYRFLAKVGDKAIRQGHVYSHRWGDASPWLKAICYEMVDRAFSPYGTQGWARYVVNRESGCNPAAINSSSQTTGIAQIHPDYHRWVDFRRVQRDMDYAMRTFLRLSRNGSNTGPWCLC